MKLRHLIRPACIAIISVLLVAGMAGIAVDTDTDHDGMLDEYELFYGLDNTTNDACFDYDADSLANYGEALKLSDPFFPDTDRDGFSDLVDSNAVSRAYIRWGDPQFTTGDEYEYAHPDWLLSVYKKGGEWGLDAGTTQSCWQVLYRSNGVSEYGSSEVASLNIDLNRTILTNNLRYAVHYEGGSASAVADRAVLDASLFVNLLDTNGVMVAENLFGNLLAGSNETSMVVLNIPTAKFPEAAVIQLMVCHSRDLSAIAIPAEAESGNLGKQASGFPTRSGMTEINNDCEIFIYEGLLYIDEDGDGLDADQERQIGTSDYCLDSNSNGTNDYDELFGGGDSGNGGGGGGGGDEPGDDDNDQATKGIIYVDQAIGNDEFTGRLSHVAASKKGPKKTVYGGLSIVETNDTIIIRSGDYRENLDIRGKDVKVRISGKVRL